MNDARLATLRERHSVAEDTDTDADGNIVYVQFCGWDDSDDWPCDTADLIAALEASRAECARLRVALVAEWACNHQERCDNTTLFHDDKPAGPYGCLCPLPDVVTVEQARAALNGAADATVGEP